MKIPSRRRPLPPSLEPAREFLDALAALVAADVVRELRGQATEPPVVAAPRRPLPAPAAGLPTREG
jgi:hypothetical protein